MKFYLEAYTKLGDERYRLQNDRSWRRTEITRAINPGDKLFENLDETNLYVCLNGEITLEGRLYQVNPKVATISQMISKVAVMHPKVYRTEKPRRFSRKELIDVLANGDDGHDNVLSLDLKGYFLLLSPEQITKTSPLAVRHETFCAGNDYVGIRATKDEAFVERTFLSSLEGWLTHLCSGELAVFKDCFEMGLTESKMWEEVEKLTGHLPLNEVK